jgi:hypothetical protein
VRHIALGHTGREDHRTWLTSDVRFGSVAVTQTIALDRLLSSAYQPLAVEFSIVAILNDRFHQ